MKVLEQVESFIEEKIRPITAKQDISPNELQTLGEAIDILKDIETVKAMHEYSGVDDEKYSYRDGMYELEDMKYGTAGRRYMDGHESYGRPMRMSYNDSGMSGSMGGNYGRMHPYGVVRYGDKEHMIMKLEGMLNEASNTHERQVIEDCINRLEQQI